jgi:hypothetical protein
MGRMNRMGTGLENGEPLMGVNIRETGQYIELKKQLKS